MNRTRVYVAYLAAKGRCENLNHRRFQDYGGRGIRFLWPSFEQFFAEMGDPPEGGTLERINNNRHYEPGNCRWATKTDRLLIAFARTQTLAQWARERNVSYTTLETRLNRGMTPERALTTPVRPHLKAPTT
jgi:hypothetical protein